MQNSDYNVGAWLFQDGCMELVTQNRQVSWPLDTDTNGGGPGMYIEIFYFEFTLSKFKLGKLLRPLFHATLIKT